MVRSTMARLLAVLVVTGGSVGSLPAQHVSPESLLVRLQSPDWQVRSDAIFRLNGLSHDSLPAGYADAIVGLLDRETVSPDSAHFGEGYGEYMIEVVEAALNLDDPRTLRGIATWGLQTSRVAEDWLARQGGAALTYLDSAWSSPYGDRHAITDTWAKMLGSYPDGLSVTEQVRVLHSIVMADSLDFVDAAITAPLPEVLPLITAIGETTDEHILSASAAQAASELSPLRDGLSAASLARRISKLLSAICFDKQGLSADACLGLSNSLNQVVSELDAGLTIQAGDTLLAFAARVDSGFQAGLWSDREHRLLSGNAQYLRSRLAATVFLHGSGGTANPPTLSLSNTAPIGTTA